MFVRALGELFQERVWFLHNVEHHPGFRQISGQFLVLPVEFLRIYLLGRLPCPFQ